MSTKQTVVIDDFEIQRLTKINDALLTALKALLHDAEINEREGLVRFAKGSRVDLAMKQAIAAIAAAESN